MRQNGALCGNGLSKALQSYSLVLVNLRKDTVAKKEKCNTAEEHHSTKRYIGYKFSKWTKWCINYVFSVVNFSEVPDS